MADFTQARAVLLAARAALASAEFAALLGEVDDEAGDVDVAAPVGPAVELAARAVDAVTPPQAFPAIRLSIRTRDRPTVGPGACQTSEHTLEVRVFVAGEAFASGDWAHTTGHAAYEQALVLGRAAVFQLERRLPGESGVYNVMPGDTSDEPEPPYPTTHPTVLRATWRLSIWQRTTTGRFHTEVIP